MFKKRSKAKSAASAPREQRPAQPAVTIATPAGRDPPAYERTKLSAAELQHQFSQPVHTDDSIDDSWEDEQLRKNGVHLKKPVNTGTQGDPFKEIKQRIQARIDTLQAQLKTS